MTIMNNKPMRIKLRTRCGCERVITDNAVPVPTPTSYYVALGIKVQLDKIDMNAKMPVRRFDYYCDEDQGSTRVYKEVETTE